MRYEFRISVYQYMIELDEDMIEQELEIHTPVCKPRPPPTHAHAHTPYPARRALPPPTQVRVLRT